MFVYQSEFFLLYLVFYVIFHFINTCAYIDGIIQNIISNCIEQMGILSSFMHRLKDDFKGKYSRK